MFYSIEMVKNLGYENLDDFVDDFMKQHKDSKSIFVGWKSNGVHIDYDFDSSTCCSTSPTSISSNEYIERDFKLNLTDLVYNKTFEEEMEEQRKVLIAESYLENLGIEVRTDMYGYYRNTYDILLDLGEYLSKNDT